MRRIAPAALIVAALAAAVTLMGRRGWADAPMVAATEMGAFGFEPGELVADFAYRSVNAGRGSLAGLLEDHIAVVVALRTVECPVSQRYGHRLAEMEREYGERGVGFLFLNVSPQDEEEQIRQDLEVFGFGGAYVSDPEADIGRVLQAGVSSEVFVIDRARTLRYRGAVDDQFGITFSKPAVRESWLRDALDAVLSGRDVEVSTTEASGCYLDAQHASLPERPVTYHSRVSRIVQERCVTCHRDGGVAPFALDSYAQVKGFAPMIKHVVTEGFMPPWYAAPEYGDWKNDITLSERDKRDLLAWIDDGAPEGEEGSGPVARTFVDGWQMEREPDRIVQLFEPQEIPPSGVLDYRYVSVPTGFEDDVWVRAAEVLPTASTATHHVIAYLEDPDGSRGRGAFLFGWAPGMPPVDYGEDAAKLIPRGATIRFELHYTPNGRAAVDRTRLGLVTLDSAPVRAVRTSSVNTDEFEIPPYAENHEVVAERSFRRGGHMLAFLPHMHLRGKAFRYELIKPDGSEEILLDVPRYDFNWQLWYEFRDPLRIEPGYVLRGRAWYDNSERNPWNPDPTQPVRYGEQTFEEMMFGFYDWIPDPPDRRGAASDG